MRSSHLRFVATGGPHLAAPYLAPAREQNAIAELHQLCSTFGPVLSVELMRGGPRTVPAVVGRVGLPELEPTLQFLTGHTGLEVGGDTLRAGGKGLTDNAAMASALGETVERLFGALHYFDTAPDMRSGSSSELEDAGEDVLGPSALSLFSEEQHRADDLPFERFERTTHIRWVRGQRLRSGCPVWVPAQLVSLTYFPIEGEPLLGLASSAGTAAASTFENAVDSALLELVERDALNLSWFCQFPPARIEPTSVADPRLDDVFALMSRRADLDIELFHHRWDIPDLYVISATRCLDQDERAFSVGTAAATTPQAAALKAVCELAESDHILRLSEEVRGEQMRRTVIRSDPGA